MDNNNNDQNNLDSQEEVLHSFKRNEREEVKVRKTTFKGKEYLDIRVYITNQEGEEIPTKKGINLPYELVSELQKAIKDL